MTLVVVGDALLDRDVTGRATRLAPDAPVPVVDVEAEHCRPGGAALAAALAARDGREVVLVTALGEDRASAELRALLPPGVRLAPLPLRGSLPVKSRVLAGGRPLLRTDHGGGTPGPPTPEVHAALASARAVLVADYGQGTVAALREVLAAAARRVPLVWDPHPRGGPPVPGARLATPNEREARHFCGQDRDEDESLAGHSARGSRLAARWNAATVAVTLGARGAVLTRADCDDPLYVPVSNACDADPCGAGDCFAATAATTLADGGLPPEAVARAVTAASTFVTAGGLAALTDLWNTPALDPHASTPFATPGLAAPGPLRAPTAPANGAAQDAYGGAAAGPIAAPDLDLPPAVGARTAPDPAPPDAAGARTALDREGPDALGAPTAPVPGGTEATSAATPPRPVGIDGPAPTPPGAPVGHARAEAGGAASPPRPGAAVGEAGAQAAPGSTPPPRPGAAASTSGAAGAAAAPASQDRDAHRLAQRVRQHGGTVVAAGGCFDLLHAGHVQFLEDARRTGDCLIVCVNSDASVRRLKGEGRPINPAADRLRVLAGLGCVDAVALFEEDTPEALLRRLRPHIWVKGGDYSVRDLPEAAALREWGGQTLVLPYLDGRSTTELARRAAVCPP